MEDLASASSSSSDFTFLWNRAMLYRERKVIHQCINMTERGLSRVKTDQLLGLQLLLGVSEGTLRCSLCNQCLLLYLLSLFNLTAHVLLRRARERRRRRRGGKKGTRERRKRRKRTRERRRRRKEEEGEEGEKRRRRKKVKEEEEEEEEEREGEGGGGGGR